MGRIIDTNSETENLRNILISNFMLKTEGLVIIFRC